MSRNDINLLPRGKRVSFADVFTGISIVIVLGIIVAAGIIVPKYFLQSKNDELEVSTNKLSEFENVEVTYYQKMQDFTKWNNLKNNVDAFKDDEKQVLELINIVIGNKPSTMTFTRQDYGKDQIILSGNADNVKDIVGFEMSLRELGIFQNIYLESITTTKEKLDFNMTLFHPIETEEEAGGDK